MKYLIDYEALVYNMPECGDFEFLDHKFIANPISTEDRKSLMPDDDILKANFAFLNCCLTYDDGHTSYITAQNNFSLTLDCDNISDDELCEKAEEMVRKQVEVMEQHLIFTTNLHIFFPVIKISICLEEGNKKAALWICE